MKHHNAWNHTPYRPCFYAGGDLLITRIIPAHTSIAIEWMAVESGGPYTVFCGQEADAMQPVGQTAALRYIIEGLAFDTDFHVSVAAADGRRSRVRLAHTGNSIGIPVNYLHPADDVYAFSGHCLCSPCLLPLPDGTLLASMDVYSGNYPQNLTLLYRSVDDGDTWQYVTELFPCFWGRLFLYHDEIYMLACSTEYGDLLIGKSTDGGRNFSEPVVLLRGSGGKNGETGIHKNPQPVVTYGGRIWNTLEWGAWGRGYHAPMVMSAPLGADLLDPESWSFSEPVRYDPTWLGVPAGESSGNIEGCLVEMAGGLYNVMRFDMSRMQPNFGYVVAYRVDTVHPEAPLQYDHCIPFPGNHSKFEIKYDTVSGRYFAIVSRIIDTVHAFARNLLSLLVSADGEHWDVLIDLQNYLEEDPQKVGFQYVDFHFAGEDILYLSRTAMNRARNFHDSNYITFHRIRNFRSLLNK